MSPSGPPGRCPSSRSYSTSGSSTGGKPAHTTGLRHPFNPDQATSPNDAYAALDAAVGYVPVALTGEDYIELLPADWRTITDTGIQIEYRTYNSAELRQWAGQSSGVTASRSNRDSRCV